MLAPLPRFGKGNQLVCNICTHRRATNLPPPQRLRPTSVATLRARGQVYSIRHPLRPATHADRQRQRQTCLMKRASVNRVAPASPTDPATRFIDDAPVSEARGRSLDIAARQSIQHQLRQRLRDPSRQPVKIVITRLHNPHKLPLHGLRRLRQHRLQRVSRCARCFVLLLRLIHQMDEKWAEFMDRSRAGWEKMLGVLATLL